MSKVFSDKQQAIDRGKRLRLLRMTAGLTRNELASLANLSGPTLSGWENASLNGITAKGAEKIITTLLSRGISCTHTWLMEGIGEFPKLISPTVYDGRNDISSLVQSYPSHLKSELELFLRLNPKGVIKQIKDDSLLPFLKINDWVGGRWTSCQESCLNQLAIVKIRKEEQIRLISRGSQAGLYNLCFTAAHNQQKSPFQWLDVKLKRVAVITRLWRDA